MTKDLETGCCQHPIRLLSQETQGHAPFLLLLLPDLTSRKLL